ncbi:NPCBM/NEW2 domain-containing protein [Marinilongibacter aquaticus]|uniref:NPCBM/NEW2 domain-containing protein n=1 Tax=Marinilongibacter aquaticus TaxID=2975157 RepID=UPI0021BDB312|nr:NPCBM/NEW2 domain-containing protein [Marinilongibacter aquaticus]UBM57972.1 NPCBM/NEW2 domain-containing protein [Marinilongibacter aquaticus]
MKSLFNALRAAAVLCCLCPTLTIQAQKYDSNLLGKLSVGTGNYYGNASFLYPFEGSVIQRNGGDKAQFSFAIQVGYGLEDSNTYEYTLYVFPLDLFTGNENTALGYKYWNLSLNNKVHNVGTINQFVSIDKGWYSASLRIKNKNTGIETIAAHINFGVGDTFLIAGQSNARGFPAAWDAGLISYDNSLEDSQLPDACRVLGAIKPKVQKETEFLNEKLSSKLAYSIPGGMPHFHAFEKLTKTKSINVPQIFWYERPIYPLGLASWCWAPLGKKYVEKNNIPVQFFNFAIDNSSIEHWQKDYPDVENTQFGNTLENHYKGLSNFINFQGSVMGFKAILWHQGERDVTDGMSSNTYKTKLENLINNIQNDFDPDQNTIPPTFWNPLNWFVSKVGYSTTGGSSPVILNDPNNIKGAQTSASPNLSNRYEGINSDVFGQNKRGQTLKIHFTGPTHGEVANAWNSLSKNISSVSGKLAQTGLFDLSITYQAQTQQYTLTPSGVGANKGTYYWVKNENEIGHPSTQIKSGDGSLTVKAFESNDRTVWTCYFKGGSGSYYLMFQPFIVPNYYDQQSFVGLDVFNVDYNSTGQSKTIALESANMSWNASINYNNSGSGWLNLSQSNGGSGDYNLTLTAQPNSGSNFRTATLTVTGYSPQGAVETKTVNISQEPNSGQLSLTSLTPTSASSGWADIHYDGLNCVGNDMYVQGIKYTQGIGTHVFSNISYNIPSGYQYFNGKVGRDDGSDNCACGSMKINFIIKLNGVTKWTSNDLGINDYAQDFSVPLNGQGGTLELIADTGSDGTNFGDWADWMNVYLSGSSSGTSNNIPAPINYSANPASGSPNSSRSLSATCNTGTVTWSNGNTGSPISVSPASTTNYTVRCVSGSQQSDPRTVTVQVSGTSSPCAVLSDGLNMGTWTVTNDQLLTRYFHSQYWLTQKVNVNGSQYDEFVVRAGEMLQRGDVNLSNSTYSQLTDCYALKYSDYGGLLGPNHASTVPFATPVGYHLYNAQDGTPYYSTYGTGTGGGSGNGPITNNGCYTIQSLANNYYLEATANDYNEFKVANNANNQKWKFSTNDNINWKIKAADGSSKYLYAEATSYCGARIRRTTNSAQSNQTWRFDQNNGGDFRFFTPEGITWDHEGAGTLTNLQVCGDNSQGFQNWRLFKLTSVGCPSGARMGNLETKPKEESHPFLSILPNPNSGIFEVSVYLETDGAVSLQLIDVLGRKLLEHSFIGRKGENRQSINARQIGSGIFFMRAEHDGKQESTRVIIH